MFKRNIKKYSLGTIFYLLILCGILSTKSCSSEKDIPLSYQELLDEVDDDISLDEILEYKKINISDTISLLEQKVLLSDKLHKLKLDKKINEDNLNTSLVLNDSEIMQLIQLEEEDGLTDREREVLLYNEGLINTWLYENGNSIVKEYGKLEIKSKVLDAINKTNEQQKDYTEYNDISIYGVDHKHGIDYNKAVTESKSYNFSKNLDHLATLIMQNSNKSSCLDIFGHEKYNYDRNEYYKEMIKYLKIVLNTDYKENNGKITEEKRYIKY